MLVTCIREYVPQYEPSISPVFTKLCAICLDSQAILFDYQSRIEKWVANFATTLFYRDSLRPSLGPLRLQPGVCELCTRKPFLMRSRSRT